MQHIPPIRYRWMRSARRTDVAGVLAFLIAFTIAGLMGLWAIPAALNPHEWSVSTDDLLAFLQPRHERPSLGSVLPAIPRVVTAPSTEPIKRPALPTPRTTGVGPDWALANGWFFTQMNGAPPGRSRNGFSVTDADGIPFWTTYQARGGPAVLGYPLTSRFAWVGLTTQVFQRAVLQWWPNAGEVRFANVLDQIPVSLDQRLLVERSVPLPLPANYDGGDRWEVIQARRLALLDADPVVKAHYLSIPDALLRYGLPTSSVADFGNHRAIRLQRAILQHWTQNTPWAPAGTVTEANVGTIALEYGLFPQGVGTPTEPPG